MKTQSSALLGGSATYLVSNVLSAASPFLLLPILTRYLSPAEYGKIAVFQVVIAALSAFVGLNVYGAAGRKFFDAGLQADDLKNFFGACFQILVASTAVVYAVLLCVRDPLSHGLGLEPRWILVAPIAAIASFVVLLRLGQWQVEKRPASYGALQVGQNLLNLGLSLWLVVVLGKGADGRMLALVLAPSFAAILSTYLLYRNNLLGFRWRPEFVREALLFGVPLIPHVGGYVILNMADRVVINGLLGLDKAGIYMVSVQLSWALSMVFDAINKAYVPWLYDRLKRDDPGEKKQIVRWTYAYFLALGLAGLVGFVVGPPLVVTIAGDAYREAGSVVGWLVLGQVFGGMYLMVTNYIFYSKRTGLLSAVTIFAGVVNIALLYLLIRALGLRGAAIAFAVAMALRFLLTWLVAQKRHPMPWVDAFA